MPTDAMLSPVVILPQNQQTYAQNLITRLSKAHKYMTAITRKLRQKQAQYYDIGRKTTVFNVGDFVVVRRPPRSGQTGISTKWLPRWTGPFCIVEKMSDADTYRLEHVETGKLLDPTNIDKLVKVEPWSVNQPNHQQLNPVEGQDTLPDNPPSIPIPQFKNG